MHHNHNGKRGSKRTRSQGHIRKRGKGWAVVVYHGRDAKPQYKWYTVHGTREDAEQFLRDRLTELYQGRFIPETPTTLTEFAVQWLRDYKVNLSPTTYNNYEVSLRCHALPMIGDVPLRKLRPQDIQQVLAGCANKGLAPKTVKHVHTVLRRLLSQAVRWGLIASNPVALVDPPRVKQRELRVWTEEEVRCFLKAAREHRLFALFALALATGMRRGELLGLMWEDISESRILVRRALVPVDGRPTLKSVKTATSVRPVAISPATYALLQEHGVRQRAEGSACMNLVFTSIYGNPVDPRGVGRLLHKLSRAAGLPRIRFHDLRHTSATLMLKAGLHPKVVSERLGHADIATTLGIYGHFGPDMQAEAAATLDSVLAISKAFAKRDRRKPGDPPAQGG